MAELADLETIRKRNHLSREQLMVLTNGQVSLSTIVRIEKNGHSPLGTVRRQLAAALGVNVDDIRWPEKPKEP